MAINMPAIADPLKSEPYEREKKKAEEEEKNQEKEEKLYKRSSFRKSTRKIAEKNAPRNSNGEMICPTCGKVIPEKIQVQTKNGIKTRVGYDLDHYPTTWAERVENMKSSGIKYTRKDVLDCYNSNVRCQCPECNQKHIFEGIKGDFANGK